MEVWQDDTAALQGTLCDISHSHHLPRFILWCLQWRMHFTKMFKRIASVQAYFRHQVPMCVGSPHLGHDGLTAALRRCSYALNRRQCPLWTWTKSTASLYDLTAAVAATAIVCITGQQGVHLIQRELSLNISRTYSSKFTSLSLKPTICILVIPLKVSKYG